jgi:hypothetical protein
VEMPRRTPSQRSSAAACRRNIRKFGGRPRIIDPGGFTGLRPPPGVDKCRAPFRVSTKLRTERCSPAPPGRPRSDGSEAHNSGADSGRQAIGHRRLTRLTIWPAACRRLSWRRVNDLGRRGVAFWAHRSAARQPNRTRRAARPPPRLVARLLTEDTGGGVTPSDYHHAAALSTVDPTEVP